MRMDVGPNSGRTCPREDSPGTGNSAVRRNCYRLLSAGVGVAPHADAGVHARRRAVGFGARRASLESADPGDDHRALESR